MINRKRIKQNARYYTNRNFFGLILFPILAIAIPVVVSCATFGGITTLLTYGSFLNIQELIATFFMATIPFAFLWILFFIAFPIFLSYWGIKYCMEIHLCKGEKVSPFEIIQTFSLKEFWSFFVKQLIAILFISLWSFLLVIPGIIKSFQYAMVPYIAIEEPKLGILDTLSKSKIIMQGHKIDLLIFFFSFILWYFAITITFGLLALYVYPYLTTSYTGFYYAICGQDLEEDYI